MHSVILDHYTQRPFDNSFHRRNSLRPYQGSSSNVKSDIDATPSESPQPTMASPPGQSVLTWSPSQILITWPLIKWTPYLATMATNPTAKFSPDLQLSCTRSDSGFEDTTILSPKDIEDDTIAPSTKESKTSSTALSGEKAPKDLSDLSKGVTLLDSEPLSDSNLSWTQTKHSSVSSSIAGTQPRCAKRALPIASSRASPQAARSSSSCDHDISHRPKSITAATSGSISPSLSSTKRRHRLSNRSVEDPIWTSRASSSRRSSTFPLHRTASRPGSFILSRNEARPIDFVSVVQRTREQQEADIKACFLSQASEDLQNESQPSTPEPENVRDHPIDWTSPDSRAAQYAEIDRKKKGIKGVWRKVRRRLKIGKGEMDFYEGGSDVGSVRRYRLDPHDKKAVVRRVAAAAK